MMTKLDLRTIVLKLTDTHLDMLAVYYEVRYLEGGEVVSSLLDSLAGAIEFFNRLIKDEVHE